MEYTIVDDKKEWTKLQPLRGALTLQQRTKLERMQMKYSAKYNAHGISADVGNNRSVRNFRSRENANTASK